MLADPVRSIADQVAAARDHAARQGGKVVAEFFDAAISDHQAQRVDGNVSLLAFDFLARIVAGRIDPGPPFSAPLTL
jgi:hypothetical protein